MSRLVRTEAFIDGACRETGLEDFGVEGWRANLAVLVDALNDEAALSELGEQLVWQWMGRRLVNRLRLVDYRRRHPEIDDQRVARPLFVCGMMRTGTTVLYELLHADPRARCLMKWESMACVPPPRAASFDDDPRVVEARRQVAGALDGAVRLEREPHPRSFRALLRDFRRAARQVRSACTSGSRSISTTAAARCW